MSEGWARRTWRLRPRSNGPRPSRADRPATRGTEWDRGRVVTCSSRSSCGEQTLLLFELTELTFDASQRSMDSHTSGVDRAAEERRQLGVGHGVDEVQLENDP